MDTAGVIPFSTEGKPVFVISDLHLAAGLNTNSNYEGTENFYADHSFVRFIDHLQERVKGRGGILVINGDFIDFLRIQNYPKADEAFRCWQEILGYVGIEKSVEDLKASITKKEVEYGLKTNDYKSIWKLSICIGGHKPLFKRLAKWLYEGNELIIVKGNHDLEWHWSKLQQYLSIALQRLMQQQAYAEQQLADMNNRIHFVAHALTFDQKIYIEHGHMHERTTAVVGEPTINDGQELSLPFGSFFNRYLINRLEIAYPFLDNVRPAQNILPVLIRERFPLAIKVMFQYIPFMLLIIPKKMYWHTFKYLLNILFIIVLPIAITVYALYQTWKSGRPDGSTIQAPKFILQLLQNFGFLLLSYFFGRIMAMAGLKSPPTLSAHAEDVMKEYPSVEAVIYGHTHDPEQKMINDGRWYFNTGTWIPIFETSSANVRMDKTYTFIAINCNEKPTCRENLQRWNDDALREDTMILTDKN